MDSSFCANITREKENSSWKKRKKRNKSQPFSPKLYFQFIRSHCSRGHFWEETELTGSEDQATCLFGLGNIMTRMGAGLALFFLVDGQRGGLQWGPGSLCGDNKEQQGMWSFACAQQSLLKLQKGWMATDGAVNNNSPSHANTHPCTTTTPSAIPLHVGTLQTPTVIEVWGGKDWW